MRFADFWPETRVRPGRRTQNRRAHLGAGPGAETVWAGRRALATGKTWRDRGRESDRRATDRTEASRRTRENRKRTAREMLTHGTRTAARCESPAGIKIVDWNVRAGPDRRSPAGKASRAAQGPRKLGGNRCRLRRIETWTQKNDGLLLAKPAAENENKNFDLGPSGETSARMENWKRRREQQSDPGSERRPKESSI
jgi:hypothetical protein